MLPNARIKNIIQKKTARIRYSTGCKIFQKCYKASALLHVASSEQIQIFNVRLIVRAQVMVTRIAGVDVLCSSVQGEHRLGLTFVFPL